MTSVRDGPQKVALVSAWRRHEEPPFAPAAIHMWWVGLLTLHLFGGLFFGLVAIAYWTLPTLELAVWLDFYSVAMSSKHHHTIAITHGIVAALHILPAVMMVSRSIRNKRLTFNGELRKLRHPDANDENSGSYKPGRTRRLVCCCRTMLFARDGLFGAQGRYYDMLLLLREVVETALQTNQGFRMSRNVPRLWLNRFFVALLVVNCWSTAFVHHIFRHSKIKMRLVALLCDCLLDLTSSVGISLLLVMVYAKQFDPNTGNFAFLRWFQDVWVVNATSEFQIILVLSWSDLVTRLIFAVSMLNNMNTMEWLMTVATTESQPPSVSGGATVAPFENTKARSREHNLAVWTDRVSRHSIMSKLLRASFFCWGIVILVLHIQAESKPKLSQCLVQVRPWGISKPACSLVLLNCLTDGLDGERDLIAEKWSEFDPESVAALLVRNCPKLELPTIFQSFRLMKSFKVYNSTITKWDEDAAFDQEHHPNMLATMFVRVNLTDGELPAGLLSSGFPPRLNVIGFVVSNLRTLPADLHTKWPPYSALNLFATQLTAFPDTLWRLKPSLLIMANTPIEEVPKELFEIDRMWYLDLAGTKITSLPEDVTLFTNPLVGLNLGDTNISSFPSWIDPWLKRTASPLAPPLAAANTPYCLECQRVLSGEQASFSAATSGQDGSTLSTLMDASDFNSAFMTSAVSCKPSFRYRFALAFEDTFQTL